MISNHTLSAVVGMTGSRAFFEMHAAFYPAIPTAAAARKRGAAAGTAAASVRGSDT
jgi:hypothetical protein